VAEDGSAVHRYPVGGELGARQFRAALGAVSRLHEAAGARRIRLPVRGMPPWTPGEPLEDWITRAQRLPIGAGGLVLSSAHQMGTARIGLNPRTSVARPSGELHGTDGVWIGDTSAFPTALGANPMCTCMALARRTAEHILGEPLGAESTPGQRAASAA
jgi:choline dehydrogenase-like flavoprotein